jgi:restriction system protein
MIDSKLLSFLSRLINHLRLLDRPHHLRRIRTSRSLLTKIRTFQGPHAASQTFSYLRKIDPYLFEELVLTALEESGLFVLRNTRYSADGGLDGRILLAWGRSVAVQCKRYSGPVCTGHVTVFRNLVQSAAHSAGLFVHTGQTRPATRSGVDAHNIHFVSGSTLIRLLKFGDLPIGATLRDPQNQTMTHTDNRTSTSP